MKYRDIDVDIRDVQRVALDILIEFDRICKKHNIVYQLFAGTLLGAVRHKGFIPWDDDIDVCLTRKEYDRFLSIGARELSDEYFLQTCFTDKSSFVQFCKIRKNGTVFRTFSSSPPGSHIGIYIDVFPLDNVLPNTIAEKKRDLAFYFWYTLSQLTNKNFALNSNYPFTKALKLCVHYLLKLVPKNAIDRKIQKLLRMFNHLETEYINHLSNGITEERFKRYLRKKDSFNEIIYCDFEGYQFPIPKNYDEVLTRNFGDYMKLPPKSEQYPHHNITEIKFDII